MKCCSRQCCSGYDRTGTEHQEEHGEAKGGVEERLKPLCLCADGTGFNPGMVLLGRGGQSGPRKEDRSHDLGCGLPDTLCVSSGGRGLLETSRRSWSGPRPPYIHSPLLDHRQQHQNQTRFSPIKTSTVSTAEDIPSLPFLETRLELAHTVNIPSWLCCSTQTGLPKSPPLFRRMPRFSLTHAAVRPQDTEGARWQSRSLPSW